MQKLFLSYARRDARVVQRLVEALGDAGYDVWIDRSEIPGGAAWASEIVDAIEGAEAVLVALSPNSMESTHVVKELALAADAKKLVLPVWIVRTTVSKAFKYYLVDVQQIDLAVDFEAGVEQLLTALEPIREGRLHAVLADPAMTTQEKIAAYFKLRAAQRDPVERRMAQLDERIRTATGVERQKLQAERWDLFQKKTEDVIAKANAATARWNRIVDNVIDAAKRDQEE